MVLVSVNLNYQGNPKLIYLIPSILGADPFGPKIWQANSKTTYKSLAEMGLLVYRPLWLRLDA